MKNIDVIEAGGFTEQERQVIQKDYQVILELVGLKVVEENKVVWRGLQLEELEDDEQLLNLVRSWYQTWLKDPSLGLEDQQILQDEWETKLEQLKFKMVKLSQQMFRFQEDDTRLDDYAKNVLSWLSTDFKESQASWKEPKVRLQSVKGSGMDFNIKFYVDHIQLEHWDRGYRVSTEVRAELIRRLQVAGIYDS